MTVNPLPLFRDADQRDDAGYRLSMLRQAAEALAIVRQDRDVADYRLGAVGDDKPLLPTQDELDTARATIERTLDCLRHQSRNRGFLRPQSRKAAIRSRHLV